MIQKWLSTGRDLGLTYFLSKNMEDAEQCFQEVLRIQAKAHGEKSAEIVPALAQLQKFYKYTKQHKKEDALGVRIQNLQPEIAILDIAMPGLSGIEIAKHFPKIAPKTKAVILTMHGDTFFAVEALRAKVCGFMLKEESIDNLVDGIRKVAGGGIVVSPSLAKAVFRELQSTQKEKTAGKSINILTPRETEILQLVAEGMSNQEIAGLLFISPATVDTHRKNIMTKLDIHSVAGLVKHAIRHKIVTL